MVISQRAPLELLWAEMPGRRKRAAIPFAGSQRPSSLKNGVMSPNASAGTPSCLRLVKLGNAVALKFLAPSLQNDSEALAQLHLEVLNARQVSHPCVCRVYDIGEMDGRNFLTMEYIDGEDFASLLRRIGRLPADKALEATHQLCAGLAAHEAGLLHRDLKPGNIMLDARGRVRITDFGLALEAHASQGRREFAGTPAYMAPDRK